MSTPAVCLQACFSHRRRPPFTGAEGGRRRWEKHASSSPPARCADREALLGERLRGAFDYSSSGTPLRLSSCRPSNLNPPRRPFVRSSFGDRGLSLGIAKATS